jgi:hypothetical protein
VVVLLLLLIVVYCLFDDGEKEIDYKNAKDGAKMTLFVLACRFDLAYRIHSRNCQN